MSDHPPRTPPGQPHGSPQQPGWYGQQPPPGYPPQPQPGAYGQQPPPGYPPQPQPGRYGQQPPSGGNGGPQPTPQPRHWWKRKFWKLPVWAWITIGVVLTSAAAAGGGGGDDATESSGTTTAAQATAPTAAAEESPESTATKPADADATEPVVTDAPEESEPAPVSEAPAPEATDAPSTTEFVLSDEDVRTLVFPIVFDSGRDAMIKLMDDSGELQSVDKFEYDAETGTVVLSVTSLMASEDNIRDEAWAFTQIFAGLWTTDNWVNPDPAWAPDFEMTMSGLQYRCNAQQMIAMADTRFSRDEWESGCRVN